VVVVVDTVADRTDGCARGQAFRVVSILVDYREGSKHLLRPLQHRGLHAEITTLPYGDLAFTGRGVGDTPVIVGIELKRLTDLVSSLRSGRLADTQLPGMMGTPEKPGMYQYGWLVIEGQYRVNKGGQLIHLTRDGWKPVKGGMHVAELEKQVLTLEMAWGVHVRLTNREEDTVTFVTNLYRWWTDKPMDAHTSHLGGQRPQGILPLSDFRATVEVRCPGMGHAMSLAAEVRFGGSLRKASMATVEDWAGIQSIDRRGRVRRLGMSKADEVVKFWRG
jgi:ERCC4-type nuclease